MTPEPKDHITINIQAAGTFTRNGWGRKVEGVGGSYDRCDAYDDVRGVTLPLTGGGLIVLQELVMRFIPPQGIWYVGEYQGQPFEGHWARQLDDAIDAISVVVEICHRLGKQKGAESMRAAMERDAAHRRPMSAQQSDADDWRRVALALADKA